MPTEVIMPKVDMDMATGTISAWHVSEGMAVTQGMALFDIETDKAAMEVESPATGTLHHICAWVGTEVAIGAPVAWIYGADETVGPAPVSTPVRAQATAEPAPMVAPPSQATPHEVTGQRATPAARKRAAEAGIDLGDLTGSGPRGRIQAADVVLPPTPPERHPGPALTQGAGTLALHRSGHGTKTPYVMIHGFTGDALTWAALEPHLPAGHPILKLELPNHGQSPKTRLAGFSDLVRQVRQTFDGLDLDAVHLVGHSLGGAVALALADTRPRQIATLTLIAPAGLGPEMDGAIVRGLARASQAESLGPWLKRLTADPETISWNFVQAAMALRSDPDLRDAQLDMAQALFPDDTQGFDLTAALHRVTAPTRIIWGKRDHVIPWRHALAAPGRVSLNLFDQAGHVPHLECPQAVARLLSMDP